MATVTKGGRVLRTAHIAKGKTETFKFPMIPIPNHYHNVYGRKLYNYIASIVPFSDGE